MTKLLIEIENDGEHCGMCLHNKPCIFGDPMWDTRTNHGYKRLPECLAAEKAAEENKNEPKV